MVLDAVTGTLGALAECARVLYASPAGALLTPGGALQALLLGAAAFLVYSIALKRGPRRAPSRAPRSAKRDYKAPTGAKIPCGSPATGEKLGERRAFTPDEVRAAYARAKAAQQEWALVDFDERRAVLMDLLDWTLDNAEQVVAWSTTESGKTATEAVLGEVLTTCEKIRWLCAEGEQYLQTEHRRVPSMLMTKTARVEYHPCGVIGAIVPFNYPFFNVLSAVVAALFSGNGIVVKPSEFTSWSAEPIEDMFRGVLARRGHNPDLVQLVTGYAETGAALVESGVEKILFIGSVPVGRAIMRTASARLTPVILELGGKDPFIVCDDADLEHMFDIAVRAASINCGQNCVAGERFYVQAGVYDRFVAEMEKRISALRQGASSRGAVDFGAMATPMQADHVARLVKDAVDKGARLVVGGRRHTEPQNTPIGEQQGGIAVGSQDPRKDGDRMVKGRCTYHQPTVLANVTHEMRIANEETFGPVMTVIKFRDEDDLVSMVNSTEFGLACSIFSRDYAKAERINSRIETGMCTINDFAMVPMVNSLPFGGVKDSGFGHFNGPEGLRGFCSIKSVVSDRFGLRTDTPKFLQYPISPAAPTIVRHALRMIYGRWSETVPSLVRMLKAILSA